MKDSNRSTIDLVKEFHTRFGQHIAPGPAIDDPDTNSLRIKLLSEELEELRDALEKQNMTAVLDALTDLQYVLDGTYLAFGLHGVKEAAFREIHRSNMSKLGPDGHPVTRSDGKILKGPAYTAPDLEGVLEQMIPEGEAP